MKTLKMNLIAVIILLCINANAQLKVRNDGSIHTGYTGYANFWLGTYSSQGYDNGEWGIEINDGDFNIWKPWPSPNNGNQKLIIRGYNGFVGIGRYPSYKLDVHGDIATYGTLRISSDERLKSNITSLSNCMVKINQLNGKSFIKVLPKPIINIENIKDTIKYMTMLSDSRRVDEIDNSVQLGFLAQEIKQVFPELVSEDSAGYLMIDYIGLIPVIIEALKEQQNTITAQSTKIKELETRLSVLDNNTPSDQKGNLIITKETIDSTGIDNITNAFLFQNTPNPFTYYTEIKYYLPESINTATLFIYDIQNIQIKTISIQQLGNGSITINASELKTGMYIYTLIADGKEIDSKRMILSQ